MGYTTSTVHGIEVPDSSEANNVPEDIGKVVTALEAGSIVKRLTGAQISALTSPQKPAGLLVYNTTTNRLQISDGTSFADLVDSHAYAVGYRTTDQALTNSVDTTITYTSESDPSSMLNAGTGVLTVPTTGLWMFTARAGVNPVMNPLGYIGIRVNTGTFIVYTAASMKFQAISGLYLATAGDTFDVRTATYSSGVSVESAQFAATLLTRT